MYLSKFLKKEKTKYILKNKKYLQFCSTVRGVVYILSFYEILCTAVFICTVHVVKMKL